MGVRGEDGWGLNKIDYSRANAHAEIKKKMKYRKNAWKIEG